jgi:carboxyl-terminal processing protease
MDGRIELYIIFTIPFITFTTGLVLGLFCLAGNCAEHLKENPSVGLEGADYLLPGHVLGLKKRKALSRLISRRHLMHPAYEVVFENIRDDASIESYLKSLDNYSRFLTPEHVEFLETREGEFRIDMGLDFLIDGNQILAVPSPGGAAESAGLLLPAFLVTINSNTIDYSNFESYRFLTAFNPGAKVRVVTKRSHEEIEQTYSIPVNPRQRKIIMDYDLGDVGVIRIDRFKSGQGEKIAKSLQKYSKKRLVVIDLRYNPGGDLYAAVDNISLFIPERRIIAFIEKNRNGPLRPLNSLSGMLLNQQQRLFVLVSRYTASSAEIFAEALKLHRPDTTVVGEKTRGKCLAQERFKLSDGSALELTTHEVIGPDAQRCEGSPLVPDIIMPDIALQRLTEVIKKIKNK